MVPSFAAFGDGRELIDAFHGQRKPTGNGVEGRVLGCSHHICLLTPVSACQQIRIIATLSASVLGGLLCRLAVLEPEKEGWLLAMAWSHGRAVAETELVGRFLER